MALFYGSISFEQLSGYIVFCTVPTWEEKPPLHVKSISKLLDEAWRSGVRAVSGARSRATWGAWLARFGVVWLDLAPQTTTWAPKTPDWPSNGVSSEPEMADSAFLSSDWASLATDLVIRETVW